MRKLGILWKSPKRPANNAVIVFFFVPEEVTKYVAIDSLNFPGVPRKSHEGCPEPAP